ncbi:MAG: DNA mismatch repair protein MutS, partial [Spirochaetia bacterium]|nr:DNA mismatch repair protein MutS [Spirochaetia bacterium]
MTETSTDTPAVRQYKRIKSSYPDAFLFFRMGDFYEMFDSDALKASSLLDLVLTKRAGQPMCGIPYHAASAYIGRLLKAGKKVAICEQKGEVQKGNKVMERVVTEVISPGTAIVEDYLDKNSNNYLLAIGKTGSYISIAYIDLSTGEFSAAKCTNSEKKDFLRKELFRLAPGEILIQETLYAEDQDIAS